MEKSPKPVSAIAPFGLRMQPALKAKLEEAAKANARSLNAEIVARLEDSLEEEFFFGPRDEEFIERQKRFMDLAEAFFESQRVEASGDHPGAPEDKTAMLRPLLGEPATKPNPTPRGPSARRTNKPKE